MLSSQIEQALNTLVTRLNEIQLDGLAAFETVALAMPAVMDVTYMPAAYVLLDNDQVKMENQYLEMHTLTVIISVFQIEDGTTGLTLSGAVYDALVSERTLGEKCGSLVVKKVNYVRTTLDTEIVIRAEITLEFAIRYAPGKPAEAMLMQEINVKEEVT